MKLYLATGASALALAAIPAPALAQHAGHHMPAPAPAPTPTPAPAEGDHSGHAGHAPVPQPAAEPLAGAVVPPLDPVDHSAMDHGAADPHAGHQAQTGSTTAAGHGDHWAMAGALGPYPMTRDASGTAWQPDTSEHMGIMRRVGNWTLMGHGMLNLVYDRQGGPRGDAMTFVSGMLMGMAQRSVGNGTLQFKAMLSPDPLMGKRGYPLLLASGETADGVEHLVDRQHPHDLFMELSGSLSQSIGTNRSVFLYGGLPGEPAFGPPAFMHREAVMDSPEAPISHHWLDSTHISFGVLTAGVVLDRVKLEVSRFNGREPDQRRYNIETGPLDSTAVRLSWNPADTLSLQGSWGHFEEPEQLEPGVDQKRLSASALYAREVAPGLKLTGTLAWGRKSIRHHGEWQRDDAFVAELGLKRGPWTIFSRGEMTENRELLESEDEEHGPAFRVGKVSVGAIRDVRLAEHLSLGAGGLVALNFVPDALRDAYGSSNPLGAMAFVRLKLD